MPRPVGVSGGAARVWLRSQPTDPKTGKFADLDEIGTVYLFHFSRPYIARGHKPCKHYCGWTPGPVTRDSQRIITHLRGRGATFTRAVVKRGITLHLVATFAECSKRDELRIKGSHLARLCPTCTEAKSNR